LPIPDINDLSVIHSGNNKRDRNGVTIIRLIKRKWKNSILNTFHVSDRLLMVIIHAQPADNYIIQVYFTTINSPGVEIENMYERIEDHINLIDEKADVIILTYQLENKIIHQTVWIIFDLGN
jgi:hypothetical protein